MTSSLNNVDLLIQIQIALIGIILVGGIFFLWRSACRLEEKVDFLTLQVKKSMSNENHIPDTHSINKVTEDLINSVLNTNNTIPFNNIFMNNQNINIQDDEEEDDDDDEDIMNNTTFVVFTQSGSVELPTQMQPNSTIEEIIEESEQQEKTEKTEDTEEKVKSVVLQSEEVPKSEELSNPLSKTKLNKMNLSELQKLCNDRGLSIEGHKADLVNRLLGIVRE